MKRAGPLRRTTSLRARSRLNPVSAKRAAIADERRAFVADLLRARPWCQAHGLLFDLALIPGPSRAPSTDCHELVRRSQGAPIVPSAGLTPDACLALCRACHRWVTDHPAEAVSLRLARWGSRPNP